MSIVEQENESVPLLDRCKIDANEIGVLDAAAAPAVAAFQVRVLPKEIRINPEVLPNAANTIANSLERLRTLSAAATSVAVIIPITFSYETDPYYGANTIVSLKVISVFKGDHPPETVRYSGGFTPDGILHRAPHGLWLEPNTPYLAFFSNDQIGEVFIRAADMSINIDGFRVGDVRQRGLLP